MDELLLVGAFACAFVLALIATPLAIKLACRLDFHDHPGSYKGHARPTPYLGGAAVVFAFTAVAAAIVANAPELAPIPICALLAFVVGTTDDRVGLGIGVRLFATTACAVVLYAAGLGWSVLPSDAENLLLTVVFVLGVVNAYNLMDNIDGATGTVAMICAGSVGILAISNGNVALGAMAFGLAGACAGFLPFNLGGPARIFLGDGGSMPIGLILAAMIMAVGPIGALDLEMIPLAVVLVGLPALDTGLVIVSRRRRRVGVLSGGRDHLTHRLLAKVGSPQRVAVILVIGQGLLCAAVLVLVEVTEAVALAGALGCIALGVALIIALETPRWAPAPASDRG